MFLFYALVLFEILGYFGNAQNTYLSVYFSVAVLASTILAVQPLPLRS